MITLTLYFATNRNHLGQRWSPNGYGKNFSADRANNLRFGQITVEVSANKVQGYLNNKVNNRIGDGEELSHYIAEKLRKNSSIIAFEEPENSANNPLASTTAFQALKVQMEYTNIM